MLGSISWAHFEEVKTMHRPWAEGRLSLSSHYGLNGPERSAKPGRPQGPAVGPTLAAGGRHCPVPS